MRIVPKIASRVSYGAIPSSTGGSGFDIVDWMKKPRKISPLSEILKTTQRIMITGQSSAQPVNPAIMTSHNPTQCGSMEGNKKGIEGGPGRMSETVRKGMERFKNVNPYAVQQVISERAEGRRKTCLPSRGCCSTWMIAAEVMIIQTMSSAE